MPPRSVSTMRLALHPLVHDGVVAIDRLGLVTDDGHRDRPRHACALRQSEPRFIKLVMTLMVGIEIAALQHLRMLRRPACLDDDLSSIAETGGTWSASCCDRTAWGFRIRYQTRPQRSANLAPPRRLARSIRFPRARNQLTGFGPTMWKLVTAWSCAH